MSNKLERFIGKLLGVFVIWCVLAIPTYFFLALIEWNFNIVEWNGISRGVQGIMTIILPTFAAIRAISED